MVDDNMLSYIGLVKSALKRQPSLEEYGRP